MKEKIKKIFSLLKNPLWIIVVLLIVMIFLLWDISQRIGHDYIFEFEGAKETIKPTGLYKAIYRAIPEIPYYSDELESIIDKLDDIYWRLR